MNLVKRREDPNASCLSFQSTMSCRQWRAFQVALNHVRVSILMNRNKNLLAIGCWSGLSYAFSALFVPLSRFSSSPVDLSIPRDLLFI